VVAGWLHPPTRGLISKRWQGQTRVTRNAVAMPTHSGRNAISKRRQGQPQVAPPHRLADRPDRLTIVGASP